LRFLFARTKFRYEARCGNKPTNQSKNQKENQSMSKEDMPEKAGEIEKGPEYRDPKEEGHPPLTAFRKCAQEWPEHWHKPEILPDKFLQGEPDH